MLTSFLKLNPFKKKKAVEGEPRQRRDDATKELKTLEEGEVAREELEKGMGGLPPDLSSESLLKEEALMKAGAGAHRILRGFYVSEKSSLDNANGQYTFMVFKNANKSEVKKEVSKLFNVKVKSVKILNMPEKRRDFGKHPGEKSGFKKAIVVLEEGYTIGQAKP